jgi:hypothetical protein
MLIGSRIVLRDISTKSIVTLLTEDRDPPFISPSQSGSTYIQFFASPLFSFLIVVHLSHTSCVMLFVLLYVVYAGCQYV